MVRIEGFVLDLTFCDHINSQQKLELLPDCLVREKELEKQPGIVLLVAKRILSCFLKDGPDRAFFSWGSDPDPVHLNLDPLV